MKQISKEEYHRRKKEYWIAELVKAQDKPNGMIGSWGFRLKKDQEFDEFLEKEGIEVLS